MTPITKEFNSDANLWAQHAYYVLKELKRLAEFCLALDEKVYDSKNAIIALQTKVKYMAAGYAFVGSIFGSIVTGIIVWLITK